MLRKHIVQMLENEIYELMKIIFDETQIDSEPENFPQWYNHLINAINNGLDPEVDSAWFFNAFLQDIECAKMVVSIDSSRKKIIELLLSDPRVDPAASYNDAISRSLLLNHVELTKLLLEDSRVNAKECSSHTFLGIIQYSDSNADCLKLILTHPRLKWIAIDSILPKAHMLDSQKLMALYSACGLLHSVLEPPTQHGPNCGFYAGFYSAYCHYQYQPTVFKNKPLSARKRDIEPKAQVSLRELRKELDILGKGSIFSTQEIQKLIQVNECASEVFDISDYQQFINLIKKSIKQNLPVVIPYANVVSYAEPKTSGSHAHWATIIGFAGSDEKIHFLLAHQGKFESRNGIDLFDHFYNIDDYFPETRLVKKNNNWEVYQAVENEVIDDMQFYIIPRTDLNNFRRKLIVVQPPNNDIELSSNQKMTFSCK